MKKEIKTIFIDLGNTLRILVKDEQHMALARRQIVDLLHIDEDPLVFIEKINERYKEYRKWAFENLAEAPESEMWTRWLVPDLEPEKVAPLGAELTYLYRQSMGRRVVVDGGREVLDELKKRGYTLGIISNLIGTREIPEWLETENLAEYFSSVVLSSVLGIRKPSPEIYLEAARRAGVAPANCAYIGDNLKRDVSGTRAAGFGLLVIMISEKDLQQAEITDENRPDVIIHEFRQLLDVFPGSSTVLDLPALG